jgi:hypothetical protein
LERTAAAMTTASQINMKIGTTAEVFRGGIQMGDLGIM